MAETNGTGNDEKEKGRNQMLPTATNERKGDKKFEKKEMLNILGATVLVWILSPLRQQQGGSDQVMHYKFF